MLDNSDAAFIGTLIERPDFSEGAVTAVWVFDVQEWKKGDLGATVGVHSGQGGGDCGFAVDVGETIGVFLYNDSGKPSGGLCGSISAESMAGAGQPIVFDGVGPPVFVIGGTSGATRLMTLDSLGRPLAAAGGDLNQWDASLCPGGGAVAEVLQGQEVAVYDTADLSILRSEALGFDPNVSEVSRVWCMDESGESVVVAVLNWEAGDGYLAEIADPHTPLWRGPVDLLSQAQRAGASLVMGDINQPRTLVFDVASGETEQLPFGGDNGTVVPSPDGSKVLAVTAQFFDSGGYETSVVVFAPDGEVIGRHGPYRDSDVYEWVDNDSFLLTNWDQDGESRARVDVVSGEVTEVDGLGWGSRPVGDGLVSVDESSILFTPTGGDTVRVAPLPSAGHRLLGIVDPVVELGEVLAGATPADTATPSGAGTDSSVGDPEVTGPDVSEFDSDPIEVGYGRVVLVVIAVAALGTAGVWLVRRWRFR